MMERICREIASDKVNLFLFRNILFGVIDIGLAERYNLVAKITNIKLVSRVVGSTVEEVYEFEVSLVYESTDATEDAISSALLGALKDSGLNFDVKKLFS